MMTGCANHATAIVDPSSNLSTLKTLHVTKIERDQRGINVLIADNFRSRGFTVSTGAGRPAAGVVDAVVTYADKWRWDITMYMLELTISIRDAKNDFQLATGNSLHTSLTRKSPTEMVDEVMGNIFREQKGHDIAPRASPPEPTTVPIPVPTATSSPASPRDEALQLQKLKELLERGLITQEEFQRKRKEILDRL